MASREEHLCRAKEEKEEQARRPDAILSASDAALHSRDVQPPTDGQEEHPEPRRVKEEDEDLTPCRVKEEEEEVDVSELSLNVVVVKTEDEAVEWSRPHGRSPSGGAPADEPSAPPSHGGDTEKPSRSAADDEKRLGSGAKDHLTCSLCGKSFSFIFVIAVTINVTPQ
ncbi:uncharacterized protein [Syngnathus scovelli]|uniref:uncharacterized protein isoform X2 n=1 Tax=Syngnathus scovelli TaxID=161590 RepID=UPI0021104CC3|nr:uncharacterized protein LOC125994031 isoform X2 [Syngnathus scovelli]XP_049619133.1 uncharacterized protein LOC125994031 isoform X2 [Syngnathus scovelli]